MTTRGSGQRTTFLVAVALLPVSLGCSGSSGDGSPDGDDARETTGDVPHEADVPPETTDLPGDAPEAAPEVDDAPVDVPADPGEEDAEPDEAVDTYVPPEMNFYFGNFHSHTSFSEGEGNPAENYAWARDVAGFDFYAVTDHAEQIFGSEWDDTARMADEANEDGVFVALRGFEWSHPLIGHSCAFNTGGTTSAITSFLLSMYYSWLDSNDGLAQFNHPGRESNMFDDLSYNEGVADNFFAIEVANKGDAIAEGEYLPRYNQALGEGWRLAPTANQDNHEQSANTHRSVFIGPALTREALLDAMRERRIYATDDPNMRLTFKLGEAWMGSRVPAPGGPAVFTVRIVDDEPITSVELVSNGGSVVADMTPDPGAIEVSWDPEISVAGGNWYYVKVSESDELDGEGPVQMAVTAPIWID